MTRDVWAGFVVLFVMRILKVCFVQYLEWRQSFFSLFVSHCNEE